MSIDLEKILQIKSKIKLDHLYNTFVSLIIFSILVLASIALSRPISVTQFNHVLKISEQQTCPETQVMARHLSQQPQINMGQYLKLMHAYHAESAKAHQLPAWSEDQP